MPGLAIEIQVFDPQHQALHQAQASTVEQLAYETMRFIDGDKQHPNLIA